MDEALGPLGLEQKIRKTNTAVGIRALEINYSSEYKNVQRSKCQELK